jgi:hypothetical protein
MSNRPQPIEGFQIAFQLYERTAERASKMAGMIGMLKANLSSLVMYQEVTPEGKQRANYALQEFEKEWNSLMGECILVDTDHGTE